MTLSVIFVNFNTRGLLKQALKQLYLQRPALDFEIIVVDNGSSDGSAEMVRDKFKEVKLIASDKNLGFAAGANLGLKQALGHYAAIFNADIFILQGSLEAAANFLDNNPDTALLGPKLINPDGSLQCSCYRFPKIYTPIFRRTFFGRTSFGKKELDRYLMADRSHEETLEVDWLLGGALIGRTGILRRIGLFDERFFLYFEDTDLGRRLKKEGYKVVYCPSSKMIHLHRRESADASLIKSLLNPVTRTHIKSAIKYFWKHFEF